LLHQFHHFVTLLSPFQARQKLATLNEERFCALMYETLKESYRRSGADVADMPIQVTKKTGRMRFVMCHVICVN
jgi:hypothetical protein